MKESRVGGHSFTHWCLWIRWPLAWLQPLKLVVVPWAWTTGVQGHTHFWNSSAASTDSGSTQHPGKTTLHKHFIETCNRRTKNGPEDESKRKISTLCSLCGFFLQSQSSTMYPLNPAEKGKQSSHNGLDDKSHDYCLTEKYSFLFFSRTEHSGFNYTWAIEYFLYSICTNQLEKHFLLLQCRATSLEHSINITSSVSKSMTGHDPQRTL